MTDAQRLLLDTHVFLRWKLDDVRLNARVRSAIGNAELAFVSAASAWEVAIKERLGKLVLDADFAVGVSESRFDRLSIGFEHAAETRELPDHHRDPFDRMLIAQARVERLGAMPTPGLCRVAAPGVSVCLKNKAQERP